MSTKDSVVYMSAHLKDYGPGLNMLARFPKKNKIIHLHCSYQEKEGYNMLLFTKQNLELFRNGVDQDRVHYDICCN